MTESLQPTAPREHLFRYLPNSLMSGATAHTVNPAFEGRSARSAPKPERDVALKLMALAAISAGLGLAGAAGVSQLLERPAPVAQVVSGSPLLKKGSDGASVRWHASRSKIYFDSSIEAAGAQAREAVQLGFGTWLQSGAKLPRIEFDSTQGARFGQVPNGKSEVMYGAITLAGHEKDLALTVTFSDPKTGEVLESDMIFNDRYTYGVLPGRSGGKSDGVAATGSGLELADVECQQKYDLQSVATHEVGHFFGLGEDFEVKPATMYYTTGRCETHKRVLQGSDETTMSALYASAGADPETDASSAKGCGGARIGQGRTGGATPLFALFAVLGFVIVRRARRPIES